MSHITEVCAKFEKKLTLGSKNDLRNLVNFDVRSGQSLSLHFQKHINSQIEYNKRIVSLNTRKRSKL